MSATIIDLTSAKNFKNRKLLLALKDTLLSRFKPWWGQNLGGVLVVRGGARTPSEDCQDTLSKVLNPQTLIYSLG